MNYVAKVKSLYSRETTVEAATEDDARCKILLGKGIQTGQFPTFLHDVEVEDLLPTEIKVTPNTSVNLDVYYASQYVQNEIMNVAKGDTRTSVFLPFEHTPVLAGTAVGTIYLGDEPSKDSIQTFVVSFSGLLSLTNIGKPKIKVVEGVFQHESGILVLIWNKIPGPHHALVSYEYNIQYER